MATKQRSFNDATPVWRSWNECVVGDDGCCNVGCWAFVREDSCCGTKAGKETAAAALRRKGFAGFIGLG
uniref:Uncharacterized protein n=1 Tax=Gossypium raimondii TaxID=29730 RepID=A0A0D2N2G2_GOSRA|nr:hypothetical protein B456_004G229900 [Gossypium raimondii]